MANASNPYQGEYKRVLCVCSAGLLRSPTAAFVLSQKPYNYNTRAAGLSEDFALIPVDPTLLAWAQEIVCMTKSQENILKKIAPYHIPILCLNIEDNFVYRDPTLIKAIKRKYDTQSRSK